MEEPLRGPEAEPREQAFARLVLPEVEVLLRVALTLTGRTTTAEDLVRDTLLRAHQIMDRSENEHPRAWLLSLMRAEVDRRRGLGSVRADSPDAFAGRPAQSHHVGKAEAEAAEDPAVGEVFHAVLDTAFAALPTTYRQVVHLVDIDGLSYTEAAHLLGVPEGTVMIRLRRARRRMKGRLTAAGLVPRRGGR